MANKKVIIHESRYKLLIRAPLTNTRMLNKPCIKQMVIVKLQLVFMIYCVVHPRNYSLVALSKNATLYL